MTPHAHAAAGPAVLLFRGRGVISSLIRWQTRSPYSHAALLMRCGRIIESWQGAGVRIKSVDDWTGIDVFSVRGMTNAQWAHALYFARQQLGAGYDYLSIARFVSRRHMPENGRWFCSELVFAALEYAGVELLSRVEPWAVSPGHLALSPLLVEIAHETPPLAPTPPTHSTWATEEDC